MRSTLGFAEGGSFDTRFGQRRAVESQSYEIISAVLTTGSGQAKAFIQMIAPMNNSANVVIH